MGTHPAHRPGDYVHAATLDVCHRHPELGIYDKAQVRRTRQRLVRFGSPCFSGFMEIDLLGPELQCHPAISEDFPFHSEHRHIEAHGFRDVFNGQHQVIELFDLHIFLKYY